MALTKKFFSHSVGANSYEFDEIKMGIYLDIILSYAIRDTAVCEN